MPFQNSASSKINRIGDITLVTAGEDQIQICVNTIFLEATVQGNPIGHTFQWVQIGGTPVTFNTPTDQLAVNYTIASTGTKVFRFFIDQGTASEQFDDVTIFDTPVSDVFGASFPSARGLDIVPIPTPEVVCGDLTGTVEAVSPPILSDHGDQPAGTILTVEFTNPPSNPSEEFILQHRLYENGALAVAFPDTPLLPVATGESGNGPPAGSPYTYTDGALTTYYVETDYNVWGVEATVQSCTQDFSLLEVPPAIAVDDAVDGGVSFPSNRGLSVTRFTIESLEVPNDDFNSSASFPTNRDITVIRFTNELVEVPNDDFNSSASFPTNRAMSVTRLDPSGIGGGGA